MTIQPVIKWSGSKRSQAEEIIKLFPKDVNCYFEPFLGGGSVLYALNPQKAICGDICEPLIGIWNMIKDKPEELSSFYEKWWNKLQDEGYTVFFDVRDRFNKKREPSDLFFLSRTCVNGLIRFNSKGEFNNSLHYSRPGIDPKKLSKIIFDWSNRISNVKFVNGDYRDTTKDAKKGDLVYLDPPYFHTRGRYYGTIEYDEFFDYLKDLNNKKIKYALSFDGETDEKDYTYEIPRTLYKRHLLIQAGNSSFKKLMSKGSNKVYESLYLNW